MELSRCGWSLASALWQLACLPGWLPLRALSSSSSGLWEFITSVRTAAFAIYNSECSFLLMPALQASLSSALHIKKKNPGWSFFMHFLLCCLSFWLFNFLSAKREEHETEKKKKVSEKLKPENKVRILEKAESNWRDSMALFGEGQEEKAKLTVRG